MKMCMPHWEQLKQAITERGLMPFVSKDGTAAVARLKELGTAGDQPPDPLLAANFAIWSNALRLGGLYLMQGEYCPLCELNKNHELQGGADSADWICHAADDQRELFVQKGWLPKAS